MEFEKIITWMDWITILFSFFAMFFTGIDWFNNRKQFEKISIYFNENKLNIDIARKDLTRQEIQGLLALFRIDMCKSYHIDYLSEIDYLDSIYKVSASKSDKLIIKLSEKELEQFKNEIYENINNI